MSGYFFPNITSVDYSAGVLSRFEYDAANKYTYAVGDASGSYTDKVSKFERETVFLEDADAFIVFDRIISSNASFEKRWTLHSIPMSTINGTWTGGSENNYAGTSDRTSTNTDLITIAKNDTYDGNPSYGKLFTKILLPLSRIIKKIGGPDSSGSYNTAGSYDFWVNGADYPYDDGGNGFGKNYWNEDVEPGKWRIEIIPSAPNLTDEFLVVMFPRAYDATSHPTSILHEPEGWKGVHISDDNGNLYPWIVFFSKDGADKTTLTYSVTQAGTLKHLLVNMGDGTYDIYQDGQLIDVKTASNQGTLYFESQEGGTFAIDVQ
jgi:hypothetical protein